MPTSLDFTISPREGLLAIAEFERQHQERRRWRRWLFSSLILTALACLWWLGADFWDMALLAVGTSPLCSGHLMIFSVICRFLPDSHFHLEISPRELVMNCKYGRTGRNDYQITIPCERLVSAGSVEESDEFLMLNYQMYCWPMPTRGVLIPKRAFESEEQLELFQEWLRHWMRGGVSLSPATS